MKSANKDSAKMLQLAHFTIETAADPVFWVDPQAIFHRVNQAACTFLGYSKDELLAMKVYDINPDYEVGNWPEHWAELKHRRSMTFITRHVTKNGRILPVEVTSNFIEFEGEEYTCSFVHEISERWEAERRVHESEKRFRSIYGAVNDGILIVDPLDNLITQVNKKATELLGYGQDELVGASVEKIHPQEGARLTKALKEVALGQPVHTDEFSCVRKDHQPLPSEISFSPVQLHGKTFILLMLRDITERKQAEAELHRALTEIEQLKDRLQAENIYLQEEIKVLHNFEEIIGASQALRKSLRKVEQVASSDSTVLILGETGTGKELLARAVHCLSPRRDRPLVKVNCAALPANLIESELFGHEKGAFTGAVARKKGRFELADGGTIFLDEIGDLSLELQSKLLRVLQEGEFERLGNPQTMKVNVRVIAATNRDLTKAVGAGDFREDLYYRLNVFPIVSPSLRERQEDIPILVRHFVKKFTAKTGKRIEAVPQKVMSALQAYHWPGNIRELENIIERAIIVSSGITLQIGDWLPNTDAAPGREKRVATLEELEREHILDALALTRWRVSGESGAAKILGLKSTTLEARMKKLGIQREA